jgi:hypothetical protein
MLFVNDITNYRRNFNIDRQRRRGNDSVGFNDGIDKKELNEMN